MTKPRFMPPKQTYFLSRRVSRRMLLLTPSFIVQQIFLYCLAIAAKRYDIEVHAICVMSNHYHLVVSETGQRTLLPRFMAFLNGQTSKAFKRHHKTEDNFWDSRPFDARLLHEAHDVEQAIIYTLANPVAAGLVQRPEEWPGLKTDASCIGDETFTAKQPSIYFKAETWPAEVSLTTTKPPHFQDLQLNEYQELINEKIEEQIEEIHELRRSEGKMHFLGKDKILCQDPHSIPLATDRGNRTKTMKCWEERRKAIKKRLKGFLKAYFSASKDWRAEVLEANNKSNEISFPYGTYLLHVRYEVNCDPAPT